MPAILDVILLDVDLGIYKEKWSDHSVRYRRVMPAGTDGIIISPEEAYASIKGRKRMDHSYWFEAKRLAALNRHGKAYELMKPYFQRPIPDTIIAALTVDDPFMKSLVKRYHTRSSSPRTNPPARPANNWFLEVAQPVTFTPYIIPSHHSQALAACGDIEIFPNTRQYQPPRLFWGDPKNPAVSEQLNNGKEIRIKKMRPDDKK